MGRISDSWICCMDAIKLLNQMSKEDTEPYTQILSVFTLQLYDRLSKTSMPMDQKIQWINSKLHNTYFYPQIEFGGGLTSSMGPFVLPQTEPELELPSHLNAQYYPLEIDDWSAEMDHLAQLHQDVLSNCSLVSAILALVHSEGMLVDLVHPHAAAQNYTVTFTFNGTKRTVSVDNRLPLLPQDTQYLTIRSSNNLNLYWPALIEKAYLKVMGKGYNIDGSNMAYDGFMLTGWVPDIIMIKDGQLPVSHIKYLKNRNTTVMMGLGTGKISRVLSDKIGLVSLHDYTLLDFDETRNTVTIKNPWLHSTDKNRIIELPANGLFQFQFFYLNWNTDKLFQFRTTTSFIHSGDLTRDLLASRPQLSIENPSEQSHEVWLFLERFFTKDVEEVVIAMDIYASEGDKVLLSKQYNNVYAGEPTNARTSLVRFTMNPNTKYTVVVHCSVKCSMSLTVFHNVSNDFKIHRAKLKYTESLKITDEWDFINSGGNRSLTSYINNPQFDLEISQPSDLMITLIGESLLTFQVLHWNYAEKSRKMQHLDDLKLLCDEPYTAGAQGSTLKNLSPGIYRIVCSTQEPNVRVPFQLQVFHNLPSNEARISRVGGSLGLFTDNFRYDWNGTNRYKFMFSTKCYNRRFTFHLKHSSCNFMNPEGVSVYRPALRGSVFNLDTSQPLMVNEEWSSSLYGVFVEWTCRVPGNFVLLVERFEPGNGTLEIEVGCNGQFFSL
ncbi:cysteine protease [Yamadazyma tenuis]|nr:cysteine protease [Yamadazyma tenuis]